MSATTRSGVVRCSAWNTLVDPRPPERETRRHDHRDHRVVPEHAAVKLADGLGGADATLRETPWIEGPRP